MHIFRRFLKECGFKAVSEVSGLTFIYPVNTLRPVVFYMQNCSLWQNICPSEQSFGELI